MACIIIYCLSEESPTQPAGITCNASWWAQALSMLPHAMYMLDRTYAKSKHSKEDVSESATLTWISKHMITKVHQSTMLAPFHLSWANISPLTRNLFSSCLPNACIYCPTRNNINISIGSCHHSTPLPGCHSANSSPGNHQIEGTAEGSSWGNCCKAWNDLGDKKNYSTSSWWEAMRGWGGAGSYAQLKVVVEVFHDRLFLHHTSGLDHSTSDPHIKNFIQGFYSSK